MLRFVLTSREPQDKPQSEARARFIYEWRYIHIGLMLTTPTVMRSFQRYVQHIEPDGATDGMFPYGRHEKHWYNMADHMLESVDGMFAIFKGEDYPRRMFPHRFGDHNFAIELIDEGTVLFDQQIPFTGRGGVKLVNWLRRADGLEQDEFVLQLNQRAEELVQLAKSGGRVKRGVHSHQLPLDASLFKGSLFEMGGVQTYAAIEELWFESLDDLREFTNDADTRDLFKRREDIVDAAGSFSLVMNERVVWDYSLTPQAAVLNENSLEAVIARQELAWLDNGGWTGVPPVRDESY